MNTRGFSALSALLLLVVVGIIGGTGWYVYNSEKKANNASTTVSSDNPITTFEECAAASNPIMESYPEQCAANGQTFTKQTEKYTDSAGLYQLSYSTKLQFKLADDCCEGAPKDWKTVSRPLTLVPLQPDSKPSEGIAIQADGTGDTARLVRQNWVDNKHTAATSTVNGNSIEYVKVAFMGDAERYTDHNYLITSGSKTVFLSFRENYAHDGFEIDNFDASEYLPDVQQIIQSVTFL